MLKAFIVLEGVGIILSLGMGRDFLTGLWVWQFFVGPWLFLLGASILVGVIWERLKGD
jgi:hypothetical protein